MNKEKLYQCRGCGLIATAESAPRKDLWPLCAQDSSGEHDWVRVTSEGWL